jgi:prevent-host-death family protein
MHHLTKATVRDLRYSFSKVEDLLKGGEEIQITKRGRPVAVLIPVKPKVSRKRPDFLARLREIHGDKVLEVSGVELLAEERGRY